VMTQAPADRDPEAPADVLADAARARGELERFFALSLDMLCVANFDGCFTRVNPAFERVLGYSRGELLREPFMSFVHPEDHHATLGEFESILSGSETRAFENRYRCADGGYRWLQWSSITDRDAGLVYAVARDVTEAKHAEKKLRVLLGEQAALRRVATVVAREGEHAEVFAVVAEEVGQLLGADGAGLVRYEPDGHGVVVGTWSRAGAHPVAPGSTVELDSETGVGLVYRTGQAGRCEHFEGGEGSMAQQLKQFGFRSSIAAPIHVEGRMWGALGVATTGDDPLPEHAEWRLGRFTELVAQALANADAREQLAASRARLVEAGDAERRRLERNLHDGAQQRLVALSLLVRHARSRLPADPDDARRLLDTAGDELAAGLEDLRELARGIHPAVLSDRGLAAALEEVAQRAPFPVQVASVPAERLPESVEVAAYYLVSEALTNTAKYAEASSATLSISRVDERVVIEVGDDGIGGADLAHGSGLRGLDDRLGALGGRLEIDSPRGEGTTIRATIPVRSDLAQGAAVDRPLGPGDVRAQR
jgi:PAS domain S-box-containing protein